MAKRTTICAGIDTGKRKLDVAIDGSSEQLQIDNTPEGYKVLLDWLRRHRVKPIGIEASGGYEQAVVAELRRKRFVVVVFQPAQVRAYAKFHLQRAKNDKIDAALIAACTAAVKKIDAAPDPRLSPFAEQLTMIDQIGEDIARLKNRLETCRNLRIKELWMEDRTPAQAPADRAEGPGGGDPQAFRPCQTPRSDQQHRRHRAAHRRCHPRAHARDRADHARAGRSACRPRTL
jgi:transposase